MTLSREDLVNGLKSSYGVRPEDAERVADRMLRPEHGRVRGALLADVQRSTRHAVDADELGKLEKDVEHACDKLMRALGFEVIRFSHPGRTKQTPGIPDRRYYHRERRLALWLEVKAEHGVQRPDQRVFQELCEAVGETYVLGGLAVLRTWLSGRRVCAFGVDNTPLPLPIEEQIR